MFQSLIGAGEVSFSSSLSYTFPMMTLSCRFVILMVCASTYGRNLDSWTSHEVSPLDGVREDSSAQFTTKTDDQDLIVFLPSEKEDSLESISDSTRDDFSEETEDDPPEEHLVVILDEKEFPADKFNALKHSSDPLSVLFPENGNYDIRVEQHLVPPERLTSFIQDRIPPPAVAKITDKISGASKPREDLYVEGQELGKINETGAAYPELPKIIPPASSLSEGMPDASDFYSQVLAVLAKVNNQDVNLLSEQFRDELQRLVSALEKDASLPLPVPSFVSNLAHQYGGGGPLSILLTGGGLNDILQSLTNFGPNPGPASFYGGSSTTGGSGSSGASSQAGDPSKDGSAGADSETNSETSSSSESQNETAVSNSTSSGSPTPAPAPNSSSRPDSFCVATGRLCQSIIALQTCCSGKPCQPFSQSFLNAFALGNLGTCL